MAEVGAQALIGSIVVGLYGGNGHIYQGMRSINLDFFRLGGGKKAFRELPNPLKRVFITREECSNCQKPLQTEVKKMNCVKYQHLNKMMLILITNTRIGKATVGISSMDIDKKI